MEKNLNPVTSSSETEGKVRADREAALLAYNGLDRVVMASEYRQILKDRPANRVKFKTGIRGLDALAEGCEGGELVVISGKTKHGKTTLAQTLTRNFAQQKVMSLWFSFEVGISQFLAQMPGEVDFCLPHTLIPYKPDWLSTRIEESKLKFGSRAVFIDHLHFLVDLEKQGRNISVDIGAVIRHLKRTCIRHNVVIFLLCHATKAQTPDGKPRELGSEDIRDSSFISQEADTTWVIQRMSHRINKKTGEKLEKGEKADEVDYVFNNKAMLKVCNHRRTGAMEQRVTLEKGGALFHEFGEEAREFRELEAGSVPLDEERPWTEKEEVLPF